MSTPDSGRGPAPDIADVVPAGAEATAAEGAESLRRSDLWSWLVIAVAVVIVVALAVASTTGWGPFGSHSSKPSVAANDASATNGKTVTKTVTVDGMAFSPSRIEVPRGSNLVIDFTNTGDQAHDLKLGGEETGRVKAGESATLEFGPVEEDVEGWCTIAGHRMQGMTLDVVATDDETADGEASAGSAGSAVTPADLTADPGEDFEAFDPTLRPVGDSNETVHEYDWEITKETREVAPGREQERWLFNGQAPGPLLRGKVGDTFRIHLRNGADEAHSFDFSGRDGAAKSDALTIGPGAEETVEFTADRPGAWMHRSGTDPQALNVANGLFGAVIVDAPDQSHVDRELGFVASEVYLSPRGEGSGDEETDDEASADNAAAGADPERVARGDYDLLAFNAYPGQYLHDRVEVKKGETVRMWVFNAGPDEALTFGVDGEVLDTVFVDGRFETANGSSHALHLGPSQGGFVEVTFDTPGIYTFGNQALSQADLGQRGEIVVR